MGLGLHPLRRLDMDAHDLVPAEKRPLAGRPAVLDHGSAVVYLGRARNDYVCSEVASCSSREPLLLHGDTTAAEAYPSGEGHIADGRRVWLAAVSPTRRTSACRCAGGRRGEAWRVDLSDGHEPSTVPR